MIELNTKAKPFNPCESYLGVDLIHMLCRTRMVGPQYYLHKQEDKDKHSPTIIGLYREGWNSKTQKMLKAQGWDSRVSPRPGWGLYVKYMEGENHLTYLYLSTRYEEFYLWHRAAEMCKFFDLKEENHQIAEMIHSIIEKGKNLKIKDDGSVALVEAPYEPNLQWEPEFDGEPADVVHVVNNPPNGLQGGFQWHPAGAVHAVQGQALNQAEIPIMPDPQAEGLIGG